MVVCTREKPLERPCSLAWDMNQIRAVSRAALALAGVDAYSL